MNEDKPPKRQKTSSYATISDFVDACRRVFEGNHNGVYFMKMCDAAMDLVMTKKGEELYDSVKALIETECETMSAKIIAEPSLRTLNELFKRYHERLKKVAGTLCYLDATWVRRAGRDMVCVMGLRAFMNRVFLRHRDMILCEFLSDVEKRRSNELMNMNDVRECVAMFVHTADQIKITDDLFRSPLEAATHVYYRLASNETIGSLSVPEYLRWVDARLDIEFELDEHVGNALNINLRGIALKELVHDHALALVNHPTSGLFHMLDANDVDSLKRLHRLLESHVSICVTSFAEYVCGAGMRTATVPELVTLKQRMDAVVRNAFEKHIDMRNSLGKAFSSILSNTENGAHRLASYVDECMRRHPPMSQDEINGVVELFHFLSDKDVFEVRFKHTLAKRLLTHRSTSMEAETSMVQRLKKECGHGFTSKMEGMLRDMSAHAPTVRTDTDVELCVTVLTSGFWPSALISDDVYLPPPMLELRTRFQYEYLGAHTGRKLQWSYSSGTCDVVAMGYEFNVSVYQCIALSLFNSERTSIAFHEFLSETRIPIDSLKRHLLSLTTPKCAVLLKSGHPKELLDTDVYSVNTNFSSSARHIKVPLVVMDTDKKTDQVVVEREVTEDRRAMIESALVRVMKTRKTLDHNNLMSECVKQLRFMPTVREVKTRIESLIERDYMARDANDDQSYVYIP